MAVPTKKMEIPEGLTEARLIIHYLIQCVKNGNADAACLLMASATNSGPLQGSFNESDKTALKKYLFELIRSAGAHVASLQAAQKKEQQEIVIKASEIYIKYFV